jgi:hypothetical protein
MLTLQIQVDTVQFRKKAKADFLLALQEVIYLFDARSRGGSGDARFNNVTIPCFSRTMTINGFG